MSDPGTTAVDFEMSMRTAYLEKEYEKTISDSARLLDGERDRVRRMEHLFLKFENEALRLQLEESNGHLLGFSTADSEACAQLQDACKEIDRLESQAQTSLNEIGRLKNELAAQKNNSASYNTVLAEKVQLSRDFAALQSDLERLKTQDGSYQAVVAKNHELERLTTSLEAQLDDEKHAHQRTQTKVAQQTTEVSNLSARIDELRKEFAGELRAKQQQEREYHQQSSGWDSQRAVLEGKVDSLNKQLRASKTKLQEVQAELQQRGSAKTHTANISEPPRTVPLQRPGSSARPSSHSGVEIATPGAVRVQSKVKKDTALPGDKSSFSITPFLNRTGGGLADSPMSSVAGDDDIGHDGAADAPTPLETLKGNRNGEPKRMGSALRRQLSPGQDRNPIAKTVKPKAREPAAPAPPPARAAPTKERISVNRMVSAIEEDEMYDNFAEEQTKPKKRKLGGQRDRSLFEDDEEDLNLFKTAARKGSALSKGPIAASKFGAPMGFSPLKRDRKRL
ncbi:hypothetical protein N7541_011056 [Penicillium brevicompactum]|uniref:Uncharacterized protein n=1 Tax=Penicillium brevicompactum TaxID=5074 RepID=A0A9W9UI84_PENBR|nr:hypothetical protein N7541_011056 [Penicillium brevicompactum]